MCSFFLSSRRRHTRCALVTGVQTCALPICISEGHARRPCWANGHEGALVLVGNLQCRLETLLEGAIRGCVHDEAAQYLRGHFLPSFSRLRLVLLITGFDRSAGCRMALPMLFQLGRESGRERVCQYG